MYDLEKAMKLSITGYNNVPYTVTGKTFLGIPLNKMVNPAIDEWEASMRKLGDSLFIEDGVDVGRREDNEQLLIQYSQIMSDTYGNMSDEIEKAGYKNCVVSLPIVIYN